jgi:hypothetical protein
MIGAKIVSVRASKLLCPVCVCVLLLAGLCFSQPAVSLSRSSGAPTTLQRSSNHFCSLLQAS